MRRARSPSWWPCAPSIPRRCCWPAPPISACWPAGRASRRPPSSMSRTCRSSRPSARPTKEVTIGAAATYARAMPVLIANFPALQTYLARLGSRQIRTMGTIGGNIGTASPIGDMPPVLLALEARLKLASTRGARELPLEEFFLGYRKTALAPDEVIESITMPKLWPGECSFATRSASGATRTSRPSRRLSPADQERPHRGRAPRLRRHGGDAQARDGCRGGAAEGRLRRRDVAARAQHGLPADRRLARHRGLSPAGRRATCCAGWSCASPSPSHAVEVEAL